MPVLEPPLMVPLAESLCRGNPSSSLVTVLPDGRLLDGELALAPDSDVMAPDDALMLPELEAAALVALPVGRELVVPVAGPLTLPDSEERLLLGSELMLLVDPVPRDDSVDPLDDGDAMEPTVPAAVLIADAGQSIVRARD